MDGSAVLARLVCVLAESPQQLPAPGTLQKWVLEQPVPLAGLLLISAIVAFYVLARQGKGREAKLTGGLLAILGAGVLAAGTLVETEGERLKARTRELVEATAKADSTRVGAMLTSDVIAMPFGFERDTILSKMETYLGNTHRIKEYSIHQLRAVKDGPNVARTQMRVRVTTEGALYSGPAGSWWMVSWRRDAPDADWKVMQLEMQQLDFVGDVKSLRP